MELTLTSNNGWATVIKSSDFASFTTVLDSNFHLLSPGFRMSENSSQFCSTAHSKSVHDVVRDSATAPWLTVAL